MILSLKRKLNAEVLSRASEDMLSQKAKRFSMITLLLGLFLLTGCGIYNGGFERGGDLTSNFLDRIQENPNDQEDVLLPEKETN